MQFLIKFDELKYNIFDRLCDYSRQNFVMSSSQKKTETYSKEMENTCLGFVNFVTK